MMNTKKLSTFKRLFMLSVVLVLSLASTLTLTACGSKIPENTVFSVDDLAGKSVGVQLGTTGDIYVSDMESDGSGTKVERYNKGNDAIQALKQGKIDAVVIDAQPAKAFVAANNELMILDEEFVTEEYAICLAKNNSSLTEKVKEAYVPTSSGSNGTLTIAVNAYFEPYEYYSNGKVCGIDVDISNAIADYLNMKIDVEDMEFDSIITAVSSGKADFGISGITVTEERLKNIDFSIPYTTSSQVVIVRNNDVKASGSSFADKFKSDFIDDARYQYLLTGLRNTLIIAICAALIGIVIGFLIAIVRSNHDKTGKMKVLNFLCNIYLTVIRGTPTMVQLLIIYYVIFSSVHINKIVVALLAFGINSGAYVAEIFRSGIMSIDNGQFEAARSLGLNYRQTMIQVILPQAFKNVLPALANEFIVLLKETSISGYIGLNDLTRGGDIIRSITYDPMLPLFGVALIYLVLVVILSSLVKKLERRLRSNERH